MHQYTHIHYIFNTIMQQYAESYSVLIAISGGQDSICLIKLLNDFINKNNIKLKIEYIYIDHQWRIDSKKNIKHLTNYLTITKDRLSIYQAKLLTNSEMRARYVRYQIIIEHAKKYHFTTIITGHTKNDNIETFLQKLIRGTTIDGATSLSIKREISNNLALIRPLLMITRTELYWFTRKFFLPAWSDNTNYNYNVQRNRLRHELLPYIQKYYQMNLVHQMDGFLNNTRIDNDYIKQNTIKLYLFIRHRSYIAINYKLFKQQHQTIQQRIIQLLLYHNFQKTLNFNLTLKIINILGKTHESTNNFYIQIPYQNLLVNIYYEWLYIS
uniref:tRNA(Ile)-lysidine synthase n=1 Tax=Gastroclonium compressum TaxID=1852973 RepID=A0A173FZV9_GASCM|nr:hypothetical protein [Coeloseira compressa]ANH09563.1 hypothetical protein [Coeloseira compressa]